MTQEQHYLVVQRDGHWKISYLGTDQGPYSQKEDALEDAIALASEAAKNGVMTEVMVEDEGKQFRTAWTPTQA